MWNNLSVKSPTFSMLLVRGGECCYWPRRGKTHVWTRLWTTWLPCHHRPCYQGDSLVFTQPRPWACHVDGFARHTRDLGLQVRCRRCLLHWYLEPTFSSSFRCLYFAHHQDQQDWYRQHQVVQCWTKQAIAYCFCKGSFHQGWLGSWDYSQGKWDLFHCSRQGKPPCYADKLRSMLLNICCSM